MNHYKITTNIDCKACLDWTLRDMLSEVEFFGDIYFDHDGDENEDPTILCSSILMEESLKEFIESTFALDFEIHVQTLDQFDFDMMAKSMHHYIRSLFESDEPKPQIIRNIFDCFFPDANNQQRFIHELHSGRISGYMYAGLSEQGSIYLGYLDYINEDQLEGVISEIKSLIKPYGGIFNQ